MSTASRVIFVALLLCTSHFVQAQNIRVQCSNQPLNRVLFGLGEKYGVQFSFRSELSAGCVVTDNSSYSNLKEAIISLTEKCNLNVRISNGVFVITGRKKLYSLMGYVYDSLSALPLSGALIVYANRYTQTDEDGYFFLTGTDSIFNIEVNHLSYQKRAFRLKAGEAPCIEMQQKSFELQEVMIKANDVQSAKDSINQNNFTPKSGIRKTSLFFKLEDFLANRSAMELKTLVRVNDEGYQIYNYQLRPEKEVMRGIGKLFAFRDENGFYVNPRTPKLRNFTDYFKADFLDNYIHFVMVEEVYIDRSVVRFPADKLIDVRTGKVIWLTRNSLRKLIADDPELLELFNDEKSKSAKIVSYLREYFLRKNSLAE